MFLTQGKQAVRIETCLQGRERINTKSRNATKTKQSLQIQQIDGTVQFGAVQLGAGQIGARQVGARQIGAVQNGTRQIMVAEVPALEVHI